MIETGAITFSPTEPLALLFEEGRRIEMELDHHLRDNYRPGNFELGEQEQLTIYFENGSPSMYSSIYRRDWWPEGCYRILNRTWKYPRTTEFNKKIYAGIYASTISQLEWCLKQPTFRSAVMTVAVNKRLLRGIAEGIAPMGYNFTHGHKLWMCKGTSEQCYQHAIIYGDSLVEQEWNQIHDSTIT